MLTLLLHFKCANFAVYKLQHCWLQVSINQSKHICKGRGRIGGAWKRKL